jgi:hypothetical protein
MDNQSSHFEEIILSPIILAGMYSHTLVLADSIQKKAGKSPPMVPAVKETTIQTASPSPIKTPEISPVVSASQDNEPAALTWLGGFGQKILVLVNDANAVHVGEPELELLGKMLAAVGLSLADVAIVNTAINAFPMAFITQQLPATTIFLFGVEPSSLALPMRFPFFQLQRWNGSIYLYSPSLQELNTPSAEQENLKKSLWRALKEIFKK